MGKHQERTTPRRQPISPAAGQKAVDWDRAARHRLIDVLPIDPRAARVLKALDDLARSPEHAARAVNLPDLTVTAKIPWRAVAAALGVSTKNPKTFRAWLDLTEATPYLHVVRSQHEAYTFTTDWRAIVRGDDNPAQPATRTRESRPAAGRPAVADVEVVSPAKGVRADSVRGALHPSGGVHSEGPRGALEGCTSGGVQSPPAYSSPPLGVLGFCGSAAQSKSKTPISQARGEGRAGGGVHPDVHRVLTPEGEVWVRVPPAPPGFWAAWTREVAARDLADPEDVEELYALAVAWGRVQAGEQQRLLVHAQAARDLRVAAKRGAVFRKNVGTGVLWRYHNCEIEAARAAVARLDLGVELPAPARYEQQLAEANEARREAERERERRIAAVRALAAANG